MRPKNLGVDARAFIEQLFATGISHRWVPIAANLLVGVSLGLPLFLYMREARRELAV